MIYGVVDVGSNTVRLCVYDVTDEGRKARVIINRKSMAGLAAYVNDGVMNEEGIKTAISSIKKCLKRAAYMNPARVDVFATAVLRNIKNSVEAIRAIEKGAECNIVLLSEEDEAHLGFVGASFKDDLQHGVLIDIGGGSSEVTLVVGGKDVARASLPQGSLSSYKAYVKDILPDQDEFEAIRASIRTMLENDEHGMADHRVRRLFGVGGSIRALAEVNAELRQDAPPRDLSREHAFLLADDLFNNRKAFVNAVLHVAPERLHTIACGLAILIELFNDYDAATLHVCSAGVREGYLLERMVGGVRA